MGDATPQFAAVLTALVVGGGAGIAVRFSVGRLVGIRPRAGGCETACALLTVAAFCAPGICPPVAFTLFGWWCVGASAADLLTRRLPNMLTLGGATVILTAAHVAGHGRTALAGALLLALPLLVAHLVSPGSLGAGDVKLALGLGAATGVAGAQTWVLATLLPPLLTTGAFLLLHVRTRLRDPDAGMRAALPHGPSMCAAAVFALSLGG